MSNAPTNRQAISIRLRLGPIPTSRGKAYGHIRWSPKTREAVITISDSKKVTKFRRRLALMHEILHLIDFLQGRRAVHILLHYASTPALLYSIFGEGDFTRDFEYMFKRRSPFSNDQIKSAISIYQQLSQTLDSLEKG